MFEFFIFAFVTAITPGPNNSMLMASGIKFGRKASIPHFLGIWLGFTFLFFVVCVTSGQEHHFLFLFKVWNPK